LVLLCGVAAVVTRDVTDCVVLQQLAAAKEEVMAESLLKACRPVFPHRLACIPSQHSHCCSPPPSPRFCSVLHLSGDTVIIPARPTLITPAFFPSLRPFAFWTRSFYDGRRHAWLATGLAAKQDWDPGRHSIASAARSCIMLFPSLEK
jgi:hypothetical protein